MTRHDIAWQLRAWEGEVVHIHAARGHLFMLLPSAHAGLNHSVDISYPSIRSS